jgi:hypothetical protein
MTVMVVVLRGSIIYLPTPGSQLSGPAFINSEAASSSTAFQPRPATETVVGKFLSLLRRSATSTHAVGSLERPGRTRQSHITQLSSRIPISLRSPRIQMSNSKTLRVFPLARFVRKIAPHNSLYCATHSRIIQSHGRRTRS